MTSDWPTRAGSRALSSTCRPSSIWSADLAQPASLPWRFNSAIAVIAADPAERVPRGEAIEDGQCGEGSSGAADAAVTGHLNALASTCATVGFAQGVQGIVAVDRDPEVRPADVPVRPVRDRPTGQDQGEIGGTGRVAQAPAPDPDSAGQGDQPGVVQPGSAVHGSHANRPPGRCGQMVPRPSFIGPCRLAPGRA